jgi:hypothetical protein
MQRVELIDHDRHFTRREAMHGLQEEAVRAAGKVLERGRRIAAGSERVPANDRPNSVRATEKTIGGRPVGTPALVPASEGPGEIRIDAQWGTAVEDRLCERGACAVADLCDG